MDKGALSVEENGARRMSKRVSIVIDVSYPVFCAQEGQDVQQLLHGESVWLQCTLC